MHSTKLLVYIAFLAAPAMLLAADSAQVWKASELKADENTLKDRVPKQLGNYGNHNATINKRTEDGQVEIHENQNDIFFIVSGEATLVLGGTPVGAKQTAPGELRANTSTGGESKVLGPGDVVHIPAKVPHWFKVAKGKQITYLTFKVDAK
jgi:mannose-6-phosphate isomerase-like protein (cupin superfamily)